MKKTKKIWTLTAYLPFFVLSACLTLNINLPESAVQRAADDYVRDIYKAKERSKQKDGDKPNEEEAAKKPTSWFRPVELLGIPKVYADEAPAKPCEMVTNGTKAKQLASEMGSSLGDLEPLEADGTLGENKEGLLVIKTPSQVKPLMKAKIEKMVAKVNALRKDFYEEVVEETSKGSCKVSMASVQKSFAKSFQDHSPKGVWVEDESGEWTQKKKKSKAK
ncbi:MAG: DUF1318 domain-containing protein [Bdellovibrionales bacterium]|nr:DUF1318 domain-containing protein [Bdellovibrionales bacterium]